MSKGRCYTRKQISQRLGGSQVAFAPTKDGIITCYCFNPRQQPLAPGVVLMPAGPRTDQVRDLILEQPAPKLTFLKRGAGRWECLGRFQIVAHSFRAASVCQYRQASDFPERRYTAVLFFEEAQ
jgi:hypothetical protein